MWSRDVSRFWLYCAVGLVSGRMGRGAQEAGLDRFGSARMVGWVGGVGGNWVTLRRSWVAGNGGWNRNCEVF